jgi:hypothetical protein
MNMRKFFILAALAIPFLFVSCESKPALSTQFETADLFGMIYDYDNQACSDVIITTEDNIKAQSDVNGRITFRDFPRGRHSFTAVKPGYELNKFEFDFNLRTQVLYIKMISLNQIMDKMEISMEKMEWSTAERLLARAKAINEKDPVLRYLNAVISYRRDRFDEALAILNALIAEGYKEEYIYLTMADIYQYGLKDMEKAKESLREFLILAGDPDVQKRLESLGK